jgi:hypothetical protein
MQNRDEIDGSQRPATADAPDMRTPAQGPEGHLGPAGSPVEGADGSQGLRHWRRRRFARPGQHQPSRPGR